MYLCSALILRVFRMDCTSREVALADISGG